MKKGFLRKLTAAVCAAVISVSTMGAAVSAQWAKSKDGDYYYLTSEGKAVTGTKKINGSYYHFGKDGKMYTGWLKKGSSYYYFCSSGKMATGWLKIDGSKYYFGKNGKMVTGTAVIDGLTYNFSSKGVWDGKAGKKASGIRAILDSEELSPDYFLADGKDEYGLNSELFSMYFGSSFTEKDADKLIKKKLAEITKGKDTNYDKVKAVYDWIIKNTSYDYGGYGNYLSCDCLINDKIGTCADYSFVFMAMMRYLGYDAKMVSGQTHTSNGGFTGHEWVEVTIGGTVYVFDPQVEDNIAGRNKGKIQYLRFCKTYKEVDGKYKK
ncbi:MAG: transglutaminase domain-containing protein [Huintestinicola sp.]